MDNKPDDFIEQKSVYGDYLIVDYPEILKDFTPKNSISLRYAKKFIVRTQEDIQFEKDLKQFIKNENR